MKYIVVIAIVILFGCYQQNKNQVPVQDVIKSHEIKQLSEAEILAAGEKLGATLLNDQIIPMWKQAYTSPYSIVNLTGEDGVKIKLGFKAEDFENTLALQLFEAYQYSVDNNDELRHSVQRQNQETVMYIKPILTTDSIFQWGADQTKMPKDSIPPFGMWTLSIPVREIVKSM